MKYNTILLLLRLVVATANKKDTVLDEQFCQHYYTLPDDDCPTLRSKIRSEIRGNGTPTLELGNKDTQPHMVLIHGWPDTSALWANQFAEFCGEDNEYFCVAPSWIDFHPDVPPRYQDEHENQDKNDNDNDTQKLLWSNQRDDFHAVLKDLELKDITFVIFDFGVIVGAQMVYFYPELFSKVIMMDIPLIADTNGGLTLVDPTTYMGPPTPLIDAVAAYQRNNINAFLKNDDELMMQNIDTTLGGTSPCSTCRIAPNATFGIGARTGWPYYNFIRTDHPWMKDGFDKDGIPSFDDWEFSFVPSFPDNISILYLWASDYFQNPKFFEWIDNRNDGSEYMKVNDSDHWMVVRQPLVVNKKITEWLSTTTDATTASSTIDTGGEVPPLLLVLLSILISV